MNRFNKMNSLAGSASLSDSVLRQVCERPPVIYLKMYFITTQRKHRPEEKIPRFLLRPEPSIDAQIPGYCPDVAIGVPPDIEDFAIVPKYVGFEAGAERRTSRLQMPITRWIHKQGIAADGIGLCRHRRVPEEVVVIHGERAAPEAIPAVPTARGRRRLPVGHENVVYEGRIAVVHGRRRHRQLPANADIVGERAVLTGSEPHQSGLRKALVRKNHVVIGHAVVALPPGRLIEQTRPARGPAELDALASGRRDMHHVVVGLKIPRTALGVDAKAVAVAGVVVEHAVSVDRPDGAHLRAAAVHERAINHTEVLLGFQSLVPRAARVDHHAADHRAHVPA